MCPSTKITNAVQKYDKQFNFAREKYLDVQLLFNDYQRFKLILFLLVLLCFQLKNSMWEAFITFFGNSMRVPYFFVRIFKKRRDVF